MLFFFIFQYSIFFHFSVHFFGQEVKNYWVVEMVFRGRVLLFFDQEAFLISCPLILPTSSRMENVFILSIFFSTLKKIKTKKQNILF